MPEHDTPWTPGPWRILVGPVTGTLHIVTGSVGHIVCNIHGAAAKRYEDARLIAAAPALYEALAEIVSSEAHVADDKLQRIASGRLGPNEGYGGLSNESASRILRGRAALALARGETNG